jgi:hypothetical protein
MCRFLILCVPRVPFFTIDVSFYQEDVRAGEGVRWSSSRNKASRLVDGTLVGEEGGMPLEDAMKLTKQLGFIV